MRPQLVPEPSTKSLPVSDEPSFRYATPETITQAPVVQEAVAAEPAAAKV